MARTTAQTLWLRALEVARRQHGAVSRRQLRAIGLSREAIAWALETGRLHRTQWRGVYLYGIPDLTRLGRLRAALLSRPGGAVLSDGNAGSLWRFWNHRGREIHISLPAARSGRSGSGITVHRRNLKRSEITHHHGIPVTTPLRTVIDLAADSGRRQAERLINDADASNLLRADVLRESLDEYQGEPGVPLLTEILDEHTFVLTDSEIERLFLRLAQKAGLPKPQSQRRLGRGRVDFWWHEYDLVVECDSLRYHRTVQQQAEDRARDHAHLLAGRTFVRFTADQIKHDPAYVVRTLAELELRLQAATPSSPSASSRA